MTSSENVHLAVDLGASSGRVIAAGMSDGRLWLDEIHRFENEPVWIQDSLQWNVLSLWHNILHGLRLAADRYDSIESVGVDTWGVDYVLLDSADQFAGPVRCYRDGRTNGLVERAFEIVPRDQIFKATGLQFMQINTLYQLLAAAQSRDPSLEIAESFLMMGDFFHWLLSGKKSVEATMASTSQLLDPRTRQWREDLMESFAIPTKLFTPVTQPGTVLGHVQESVATATGLVDVPVIVPATHDTASAIVSVPADDFAPQKTTWCYLSSGTWSLMGVELAEPKVNDLCAQLNFTNEGGVQGSTRLLKNIGGLWVFQQIRKSQQRRGKDVSWEAMVEQAEAAPPFTLLLDPDEAEFVAPHDMIDAINSFAQRTGQLTSTGQEAASEDGVYYRAALEGLALRYRACLGMLESLVEERIETIHIVGGGSLNRLLCQMTADACNRTVVAGPVEATAIGNVVMQMIGTGRLQSIVEARQMIRHSFDTVTYQPQNATAWDEPAQRFAALAPSA